MYDQGIRLLPDGVKISVDEGTK